MKMKDKIAELERRNAELERGLEACRAQAEIRKAHRDEIRVHLDALVAERRHLKRELDQILGDLRIDIKPRNIAPSHKPTRAQEILAVAEAEWTATIRDDNEGAIRIDQYIRGDWGLNWGSAQVRHLDKPLEYVPGSFSWCGAFVAFCYGMAASLRPQVRKKILPSCSRLWSNWGSTARLCSAGNQMLYPEPGDIITINNNDTPSTSWGQHIVLCETVIPEEGQFLTFEGNGWGTLGDGLRGEGVVKNRRELSSIARIYRPLEGDFE